MKKMIIAGAAGIILAAAIFSNTAAAKSVKKKIEATFGAYIVQFDGKNEKAETLYYNKKVYVPVSDAAKLTGSTVTQSKNTVNFSGFKIKKLKLMAEFIDTYKTAEDISREFDDLNTGFGYAFDEFNYYGTHKRFAQINTQFKADISVYNKFKTRVANLEKRAKSEHSYVKSDFDIFKNYFTDMNDEVVYTQRYSGFLQDYFDTKDDKMFYAYIEDKGHASDLSYSSQNTAKKGYSKYINASRNFK
ncbi:hypothetical protein ACFVHQ_21665 [Actinomycetes bacterium NPDC127524]